MENSQLTCPKCGSVNIFAKGTKGATFRTILEAIGIGLSQREELYEIASSQSIQYKCRSCKTIFIPEKKALEIQEELKEECLIIVHRKSGMVGALMPFYVYLNGNKVGAVQNNQCIEFTTKVKLNAINITDSVGNAFKDTYRFNAVERGKIVVYFNRKFIRN